MYISTENKYINALFFFETLHSSNAREKRQKKRKKKRIVVTDEGEQSIKR